MEVVMQALDAWPAVEEGDLGVQAVGGRLAADEVEDAALAEPTAEEVEPDHVLV